MARSSRRSKASGLPHLVVGLALGLAVAAGVYFSDVRSGAGLPETVDRVLRSRDTDSSSANADETRSTAEPRARASTQGAGGATSASGGAQAAARSTSSTASTTAGRPTGDASRTSSATTPANEEPRFDFYEILPQTEVLVPDEPETVTRRAAPAAPATTAARTAPVAAAGSYMLQTGSFRSHADADRMQASLALLGVESRIQKVAIADGEFHRVRIGPVSNLDDLNRLRTLLRQAGIESLMVKVD